MSGAATSAFHLTGADRAALLVALLLLATLHWHAWAGLGGEATTARIVAGGSEFAVVRLDRDQTLEVPGPRGITVVEVRDGRIRCARSPGPNRICEAAGWLSRGGESAISLPNRVVIQVIAAEPAFDSVHF